MTSTEMVAHLGFIHVYLCSSFVRVKGAVSVVNLGEGLRDPGTPLLVKILKPMGLKIFLGPTLI